MQKMVHKRCVCMYMGTCGLVDDKRTAQQTSLLPIKQTEIRCSFI